VETFSLRQLPDRTRAFAASADQRDNVEVVAKRDHIYVWIQHLETVFVKRDARP
jgi:hypothetical protein